jgi:hypothetical protein
MLHAPACESKQRSNLRTQLDAEPQREFHPPFGSVSERGRGLADLHSAYGNQAVLRMLSRAPASIQTRLTVSQPGDAFEQEADRVADHVMRMSQPSVQRECSCDGAGGDCPECKKKEGALQRAANGPSSRAHAPGIVHDVLRSPGQPLDANLRAFMEPRFGRSFSDVRVHTDEMAINSARAVNALAYTVGNHVVFRNGLYDSGSQESRRLVAHELAHVIQQGGVAGNQVQREPETEDKKEQSPATAGPAETPATGGKKETAPAGAAAPKTSTPPKGACTRTILSEGSCADLVAGSKFICCDPDKGFERKGKTKDVEGTDCPDQKFTPIFTCDHNCKNALSKGCSDDDNWIAVPPDHKAKCGDVFTICANGKSTTGYMRDRSVTHHSFEVSPGIQKILGVTVGSSFKGSVYRPGASSDAIAKDKCCNS